MDGDQSAKTFDSGANSAIRNAEGSDSIHEASHQADAAGEKTSGTGASIFHKDGAVGRQFTTQGAIGGTAQNVGGPFAADGAIGKNFTAEGSIGGMVQQNLANKESN